MKVDMPLKQRNCNSSHLSMNSLTLMHCAWQENPFIHQSIYIYIYIINNYSCRIKSRNNNNTFLSVEHFHQTDLYFNKDTNFTIIKKIRDIYQFKEPTEIDGCLKTLDPNGLNNKLNHSKNLYFNPQILIKMFKKIFGS